MKQVVVSQTGSGNSAAIGTDLYISPFNVGFGVVVASTVDYTVQHTFDNLQTTASPTWFDHPTIDGESTNMDGNYAFPVAGIRVKVNSGGGTATLTAIQAGIAVS
jgi:hypothetical protein